MISRRDILIGGACLAAAGGAEAMRPRGQMSLIGDAELDAVIPKRFAGWAERETNGIVVPQSEDSLSARLYSQVIGRLYVRDGGDYVMLLIAYGDTQNDLLQLHRPEVCYPAFGFRVTASRPASIELAEGVSVPGRELTAVSPQRTEHISYWTRIGHYLPVDGVEQQLMKLRAELKGHVPDGVLVRFSNALADPEAGYRLNREFAADLMAATPLAIRPALVGAPKARALAAV